MGWGAMTGEALARAAGGGALIGLAAALLVVTLGRVAGVSGILGGLIDGAVDWRWRAAFILGMIAALPAATALGVAPAAPVAALSGPMMIVAGVLVGFGARLGSGCTSGHGVCGLARLSPRSLAATATFMATAALTVWALRHGLGGVR